MAVKMIRETHPSRRNRTVLPGSLEWLSAIYVKFCFRVGTVCSTALCCNFRRQLIVVNRESGKNVSP